MNTRLLDTEHFQETIWNSSKKCLILAPSLAVAYQRVIEQHNLTSEDELELYDLLKKDDLTRAEEQRVKLAARDLIIRLLEGHPKVLVQEWWKHGQTQATVKQAIEEVLNEDLPDSYDRLTCKEKCGKMFERVVGFAANGRRWVT